MPPVPSTERVGTRIAGKYEILRLVAEGGMGSVFEATHLQLRRRVALKLLRPEFLQDSDAVERFLREARAAAAVTHPSVVEIFDYGRTDEGTPYIAMAYLEGESLAERLYRAGRIDETTAVLTLLPVVSALTRVHARGIIHRDLKPENILVTRDKDGSERAVLLDFGVARFESDPDEPGGRLGGVILGTPAYMSPEQASGASSIDARSDIYALGATFYELVSGAAPYQKGTYEETIASVRAGPPRPLAGIVPTVSPAMEATVSCAMSRDPAERFATMEELGHALEEVLAAPTHGGLTLRGRPAALASLMDRASRQDVAIPGADLIEEGGHTVMMDPSVSPMIPSLPSVPSTQPIDVPAWMGQPDPPPTGPFASFPSPLAIPTGMPGWQPPRAVSVPPPPPTRERASMVAGVLMGLAGLGVVAFAALHTGHRTHTVAVPDAAAPSPLVPAPVADASAMVTDAGSAAPDGSTSVDAAGSADAGAPSDTPSEPDAGAGAPARRAHGRGRRPPRHPSHGGHGGRRRHH